MCIYTAHVTPTLRMGTYAARMDLHCAHGSTLRIWIYTAHMDIYCAYGPILWIWTYTAHVHAYCAGVRMQYNNGYSWLMLHLALHACEETTNEK